MLPPTKRRNSRALKLAPVAVKFKDTNDGQTETAANSVSPAEDGAPFGQAMQSLFALVGQMRNISPDAAGTSPNPKLILSSSGLELRLSGQESTGASESTDRLAEMERGMKLLIARIAKLEEQLGAQNQVIDSLRTAVQQSEEMMDTLVDSMDMIDDLGQSDLGLELMLGPKTLAS
jgi:uncharacterized coiled-coil protein SlyX